MREGRERKKRNIIASIIDHGNNVEQNVDKRSSEITEEK